MSRLDGRVAIVTGAGRGIGRGIARRFASEGAKLVIAELEEGAGRRVAEEIGGAAIFVPTDVGVKADVQAMVERTVAEFGAADILVNNAWGGGTMERLEHKTDAAMEHAWRVGLMSAFWSMQAVFPHMRDAAGGASSTSAR